MQMSFQVLELRKNHILPKLIDLLRDRRDRFVFSEWEVTIVKIIKMPDTPTNLWNGHGVPCQNLPSAKFHSFRALDVLNFEQFTPLEFV